MNPTHEQIQAAMAAHPRLDPRSMAGCQRMGR